MRPLFLASLCFLSLALMPRAAFCAPPPTLALFPRTLDNPDDMHALADVRKKLRADAALDVLTYDPNSAAVKRAAADAHHPEWVTDDMSRADERLALARALGAAFYAVVSRADGRDKTDIVFVDAAGNRAWNGYDQKPDAAAKFMEGQALYALAHPVAAAVLPPAVPARPIILPVPPREAQTPPPPIQAPAPGTQTLPSPFQKPPWANSTPPFVPVPLLYSPTPPPPTAPAPPAQAKVPPAATNMPPAQTKASPENVSATPATNNMPPATTRVSTEKSFLPTENASRPAENASRPAETTQASPAATKKAPDVRMPTPVITKAPSADSLPPPGDLFPPHIKVLRANETASRTPAAKPLPPRMAALPPPAAAPLPGVTPLPPVAPQTTPPALPAPAAPTATPAATLIVPSPLPIPAPSVLMLPAAPPARAAPASAPDADLAAVKATLDKGDAALSAGSFVEAIADYRDVINRAPLSVVPRLRLAAAYLQSGRRDKALSEAQRALQIAPASAAAGQFLMQIDAETGSSDGAVARYAALVGQNPDDPAAHLALGDALWNNGQLARAEDEYKSAQTLASAAPPTAHAAAAHLARLYAAQSRYDDSLSALKDAGAGGYALALGIVQSRADTLRSALEAAQGAFDAGRSTHEKFYKAATDAAAQSQALAGFVVKVTPPAAFKVSHLHRVLATHLIAQQAAVLVTYVETANASLADEAARLDREAQTEMLTAHAAEQALGLWSDARAASRD